MLSYQLVIIGSGNDLPPKRRKAITLNQWHDDVIKWRHFPRYWPFVPVNSPHKASDAELWCFSLIWVWINGWVTNREAGDLRSHRARCDVIVMMTQFTDAYIPDLSMLSKSHHQINSRYYQHIDEDASMYTARVNHPYHIYPGHMKSIPTYCSTSKATYQENGLSYTQGHRSIGWFMWKHTEWVTDLEVIKILRR